MNAYELDSQKGNRVKIFDLNLPTNCQQKKCFRSRDLKSVFLSSKILGEKMKFDQKNNERIRKFAQLLVKRYRDEVFPLTQ